MMKTAAHLVFLFTAIILSGCQKEMNFLEVTHPKYDSLSLVNAVTAINYDVDDRFLSKSEQVYTYDESGGRTVVAFRDSTGNGIRNIVRFR